MVPPWSTQEMLWLSLLITVLEFSDSLEQINFVNVMKNTTLLETTVTLMLLKL
jgi:hypothetical protein